MLFIFFPLLLNNPISPGHYMSNPYRYETNGGTVRSVQGTKNIKYSGDGRKLTVNGKWTYKLSTPWDINTAEFIK